MSRRFLLFLLMLVACLSGSEEAGLTAGYIRDSSWEWHAPEDMEGWPRYRLEFQEDGTISDRDDYSRQLGLRIYGEWKVVSPSRILLRYVECSDGESLPEQDGEILYSETAHGVIRRLKGSVFHEYAVDLFTWGSSPSVVLLSEDFTVRPNLRRTVNGVEVTTMGAVFGMTTKNVRLRTAPSVAASFIRFPNADYYPKGRYVRVLARTLRAERVQQWTNYWYYVENIAEWGSPRYGWMFGEFVSFSEEEVREAEITPRPWELPPEDDEDDPEFDDPPPETEEGANYEEEYD